MNQENELFYEFMLYIILFYYYVMFYCDLLRIFY